MIFIYIYTYIYIYICMIHACKLATYVRVYKCTQCTHHVNLEA